LQDPRGIAVDATTGTLFLADQDTNTIFQGDLDGKTLTPLILNLNAPADLIVKSDTLYWPSLLDGYNDRRCRMWKFGWKWDARANR